LDRRGARRVNETPRPIRKKAIQLALELEIKLRVESHETLRRRLRAVGATPVGRVFETNHILDTAEGTLRARGSGLRLRVSDPADGASAAAGTAGENCPTAGAEATLTFKGPVQPAGVKQRKEIEARVGQPETMLELLGALGFVEVLCYRKRRESFLMESCRVELDEVPLLGLFVEIEGPDEDRIRRVQRMLELHSAPAVADSYVALLARRCEEGGLDPRKIDFETT